MSKSFLLPCLLFWLCSVGVATPLQADPPTAKPSVPVANQRLRIAPGTLPEKLRRVWRFKTGGPVTSSPVVSGNRLFVGSEDGKVYALRTTDGKLLWSFKTGRSIEATPCIIGSSAKLPSQRIFGEISRGDNLTLVTIGSSDGNFYALDAVTGKLRWKFATNDKILGAANTTRSPDGKSTWVLFGSYDNHVYCLNAANGKLVWSYETDNYINGTPAISGNKVVFGGCDGFLHVIGLKDGKKQLSLPLADYIAGSATVDGNNAYLGHYGNAVVCADIAAGKEVWTFRDRGFPYFSTPAVTPDRVVIGGRDRRVHCLNRADGSELWQFRAKGKVDSSPVICDGKVVVGSEDGNVYLLRLADGKELWSYTIGRPVMSSPYIVNGAIFIGADDGYVYAFR